MPKLFILFGLVVAALLAGYWSLLFLTQRSMLFPAPGLAGAPVRPVDAEQVWLTTATGRIEAWFLPPSTSTVAHGSLIIFTHGNGELIDFWPAAFDEPRSWGVAVLLVEYPGYGRSPGHPSESTITQGVLAAYDWAQARPGIDPSRIVAHGRSVGGGAACQLAARRPLAALVLESTFTSVRSLARGFGAPAFLVRDPFDNLAVVRQYRGPLLLLHGSRDDIIVPGHSRALAAAAHQTELHLLPCGHNDCPEAWPLIHTFLEHHGILPPI
ncbi:MAG TPA: alpha/beta hydrolase [Thermoanaerobaculia bacterium]|nr:alpha/beta hydrolase [Thermoanaerobaculia bacterium]